MKRTFKAGATVYVETGRDGKYVVDPATVLVVNEEQATIKRAGKTEQWHVSNLHEKAPLPRCAGCQRHRTRKPLCRSCQRWADKRAKEQAARARIPGTVANLGVDAFLAALTPPVGFIKTIDVETWPREGAWPRATFTGHDGRTTLRIVITDPASDWAPGSGHTEFESARGHFSFDRHGVEDSFYVNAEDTTTTVEATLAAQIEKVVAARLRHETSETVPFVGGLVTPERKIEIAKTLRSGGVHTFTPAGFGTGYRMTTNRQKVSTYARQAPEAFAAFFGVAGTVYYDTLDCD